MLVKLLLDRGTTDINVYNDGGKTPLMFSAMFSHRDIVGYLIGRGADTKAQTFLGMSTVQMARITGGARTLVGKFVI